MSDHSYFSSLIWQIADLLRGPYRPPQYERVMLPMTVLRRFDCVLAPTKPRVLAEHERLGGRLEGRALDARLNRTASQFEPVRPEKRKHGSRLAIVFSKDGHMFEAKTSEGYKICIKDDLVINTLWAWMGAMGIAPVDGIVSPAYHVYEIGDELEPSYVDLLARLAIFAQEVTRHSKGVWSSRLRLYPEGLFNVTLPVPPIEEQQEIVSTVAAQTNTLNQLVEAVHHAISLLTERRSALVSAAVTGQIEVEGAA